MRDREEGNEDSLNGQIFEGYKVVEVIGCGTFGKVYKIQDTSTGHTYAMKHVLQNKKFKNRQLEILRSINSDFVVKLHHYFYSEIKENVYLNLVMEYMPQPLSRTLKTNFPYKKYLPTPLIVAYAKCILIALRDMHTLSICHRDIKPSNILISENTAKLCDFGSAKVLTPGQKNIAYICSRYYRAPELLFGAIYYTQQVDVWSLGCVIAEMMTNHSLFEGSNSTAMLSKIIKCIGSPSPEDLRNMQVEDVDIAFTKLEPTGLRHRILKLNPDSAEQLIDLVERMVVYNPMKRITATDALKLPIFN